MYEIEILQPTCQYGNIKLKADLRNIDNGKTEQENVEDLINKAKYIANELKK
jgi:hypothetical protein